MIQERSFSDDIFFLCSVLNQSWGKRLKIGRFSDLIHSIQRRDYKSFTADVRMFFAECVAGDF